MPNDHDMLHKIYTEMVGLDGKSGMVAEHREMKKDVNHIKKNMITKEECKTTRENEGREENSTSKKRWRNWQTVTNIVLTLAIVLTFLYGAGVLKFR